MDISGFQLIHIKFTKGDYDKALSFVVTELNSQALTIIYNNLFISSPGDVANKRQICGKVIERIQRHWSLIHIEDVFWENEAMRATATFQDEFDDPAECGIVIGIIWTKMGSPLPERFTRPTIRPMHPERRFAGRPPRDNKETCN